MGGAPGASPPREIPALGGAPPPLAQRLLEQHVEWRGGRDALEALMFLERRGDVRIGANEGVFRAVGSRDGWLRYDVQLEGVQQVEAVTPYGGWRWVNGEVTDLDDERIGAFRTSIDEMFARHLLLEQGYEAEYLGSEARDGTEYEVLRLQAAGNRIDLFLLPDGSLHWTREPEEGDAAWTRLDDWRLVDGVRFAFRADRRPDDPGRRQLTAWKEVIVDGEINADEFRRPPAQSGTLEFDGAAEWIPVNLYLDGYLEIAGQVVGRDVRVMLDSGAGITVLDRAFAEEIGLVLQEAGTIQGIGGEVPLFVAGGVSVSIPGVTLRDATVAVLDLGEIADKLGRGFEVILGVELFTRAVVTVDYPSRRVRVEPPHAYEPASGARSVRLLSRGGIPAVRCRFEDLPETLCDIDTGSNSTIDIVAHYVEEFDMIDGRPMVSRIATGGVGGIIETPVSTLEAFSFAGVPVGSTPANFMAEAVGSLDTDEIAGNIGAGVLRSFVLVFDHPGMRLHVLPSTGSEAVRRDRSGVQAIYRGDHLEVFFIAPGSPAAAAGLQRGDRITAIDGQRIGPAYVEGGFRWGYAAPGTEVVLIDDVGSEVRLVLADYF